MKFPNTDFVADLICFALDHNIPVAFCVKDDVSLTAEIKNKAGLKFQQARGRNVSITVKDDRQVGMSTTEDVAADPYRRWCIELYKDGTLDALIVGNMRLLRSYSQVSSLVSARGLDQYIGTGNAEQFFQYLHQLYVTAYGAPRLQSINWACDFLCFALDSGAQVSLFANKGDFESISSGVQKIFLANRGISIQTDQSRSQGGWGGHFYNNAMPVKARLNLDIASGLIHYFSCNDLEIVAEDYFVGGTVDLIQALMCGASAEEVFSTLKQLTRINS
jgi:hypothetical protein